MNMNFIQTNVSGIIRKGWFCLFAFGVISWGSYGQIQESPVVFVWRQTLEDSLQTYNYQSVLDVFQKAQSSDSQEELLQQAAEYSSQNRILCGRRMFSIPGRFFFFSTCAERAPRWMKNSANFAKPFQPMTVFLRRFGRRRMSAFTSAMTFSVPNRSINRFWRLQREGRRASGPGAGWS